MAPSLALGSRVSLVRPRAAARQSARPARAMPVVKAASVSAENVPDMGKRTTMNLLLAGAVALPVGSLAVPFALFFVPKR